MLIGNEFAIFHDGNASDQIIAVQMIVCQIAKQVAAFAAVKPLFFLDLELFQADNVLQTVTALLQQRLNVTVNSLGKLQFLAFLLLNELLPIIPIGR